ncbi:hypothetical protein ASPVEDRAFT_78379 [Aspergillus versicolor CBS 583.65]|uniref:Rhodopsin domain-containing protein n=1 Tax=Aspergillus versicolor CBS 583.65 TaxID=1036611 RepID=A0A1L9P544_ASPVE|nr:uncharacterized protein ASPVEDRAFT_78379 [Aspergillus versicolor CBS 583.65]OJI96616.1 hypothetical protein ASPVEDRAFT_78379 [Aspergillus versicolor CBS 583.65]
MPEVDDRTADTRAVFIVFIPLVCLSIALRCYVRGWVVKAFGWDDGLMILAFAVYITGCALTITGTHYGSGHGINDLTKVQGATARMYAWFTQVFYVASTGVCKVSVCFFLIRITVRPLHLRLLYAMLAFILIHSTLYLISCFVMCQPLEYLWTRLLPGATGTCVGSRAYMATLYTAAAVLCLIDIVLGIVIPFLIVHRLQMPKATKLSVLGIMGLGCLATVALFLRFPYLAMFDSREPLNSMVDVTNWSYVEVSLNIFAGSLATLGPLLRAWFRRHHRGGHAPTTDTTPNPRQRQLGGRPRGVLDLSFPLSTLDESVESSLRPDKLCVTVTQVRSQRRSGPHDANISQEELTVRRASTSAGSGGELEIYRTTEMMQTSDVESDIARERV